MVEIIGFPGYYVDSGKFFHNGKELKPHSGCIKLYVGNGEFFRMSNDKMIYAAENGIDPRKLKSSRILVRGGKLTTMTEVLRKCRQEKALKTNPKTKSQRIAEVTEYIDDAKILLAAYQTDDWTAYLDRIERYRGLVYDYAFKRYGIKSREYREEIFCEARIRVINRIQNGNILVNLKAGLLKYVNVVIAENRKSRIEYLDSKKK